MYKVAHTLSFKKHFKNVILVILFFCLHNALLRTASPGCDFKNRLTIGKISIVHVDEACWEISGL